MKPCSIGNFQLMINWGDFGSPIRIKQENLKIYEINNYVATARGANLEILQEAIDNNIINLADISKQVEDMKNKDYLNKHKYSIWYSDTEKRYYTYLPDATAKGGKRKKHRKSREVLEKMIIEFYKKLESETKIETFKDAYFLWREKHDGLVSANSVAKYKTDYRRFFEGTNFEKMRLKNMMDDDINSFMVDTIQCERLDAEGTRKLLSYIKHAIRYARKYKAMEHNPVEFIEANNYYRYCTEKEKKIEDEIMSPEEMQKLQFQIKKDHEKKPYYIPTYAVEMAMLTGMRVAEVSALRWDRITDDYIIIDSSEKSNPEKTEFWIGKTKTGKSRKFPIDNNIRVLLDDIERVQKEYGYDREFVFSDENGRVHGCRISSCLKTKCRQAKIKDRGIYALRKTFNSALRCNGVSAVVASQLLGHTVETNNKYYTFDNTNMEQKNKIVAEVNNRFKGTLGDTSLS